MTKRKFALKKDQIIKKLGPTNRSMDRDVARYRAISINGVINRDGHVRRPTYTAYGPLKITPTITHGDCLYRREGSIRLPPNRSASFLSSAFSIWLSSSGSTTAAFLSFFCLVYGMCSSTRGYVVPPSSGG